MSVTEKQAMDAPRGLPNLGNTCGINALLQCMCQLSSFESKIATVGPRGDWANALASAINENDPRPMSKQIFDYSNGMFAEGEQHDLSELWIFVTDAMQNEGPYVAHTGKAHRKPARGAASGDKFYESLQCAAAKCLHTFFPKGVTSAYAKVMGQTITQIHCQKCDFICHNHEPFSLISVEPSPHLEDSIAEFLNPETIHHWTCDRCKSTESEKLVRFWTMPKTLCIALKRFEFIDGRMHKKHTAVTIPMRLRFASDLILSSGGPVNTCGSGAALYRVKAIGLHHGNGHGGHYTALVSAPNGSWYHMDDDVAFKLDDVKDTMKNNTRAYLIFYEQT